MFNHSEVIVLTNEQTTSTTTTTTILRPFVLDCPGEQLNGKKDSPTHTYPDHQSSFICILHLLRSMESSLFNLCAW